MIIWLRLCDAVWDVDLSIDCLCSVVVFSCWALAHGCYVVQVKARDVTSYITMAAFWNDDWPYKPRQVFPACFVLTRTLPGKTSQEVTHP